VVCPTGIDIRNGTQLECVNCTACIDECDTMMDNVGLPKGLIRYTSEDEINNDKKFEFTPRMKGYAAVLLILSGLLIGMLFLRSDVQATILRLPGQLFQEKEGQISNVFTYKVVNKTSHDYDELTLKLASHQGEIKIVGGNIIKLPAQKLAKGTLFIEIPSTELKSDKTEITIEVYHKDKMIEKTKTNFMSPRAF
jgi:polyferredoxin